MGGGEWGVGVGAWVGSERAANDVNGGRGAGIRGGGR